MQALKLGGWAVTFLVSSLLLVGAWPAAASPPGLPSAGGTLWVVNENGWVSIYDAGTGTILTTIAVGTKPIGITALPEFEKVYIPNEGSDSVSVISTATMSVVATIGVGPKPHDVWRSPDGSYVYVSEFGQNTVALIDTTTDTVVTRFTAAAPTAKTHAVWVPKDGRTLYALNRNPSGLAALDPLTGETRWSLAAGSGSHMVTSANGKIGFLSNASADAVEIVDLMAPAVLGFIPVGDGPDSLWLSANGRWLLTANAGGSVSIVDLSAGFAVTSLAFTGTPRHVTTSANSRFAYVTLAGSAPGVAVIDLESGFVATTYGATGKPHGIFYMPMRMG